MSSEQTKLEREIFNGPQMRTMNRSLTVGRKLFDCLKSLEKTTTLIITLKIPNTEMLVKMICFRGIFHPSTIKCRFLILPDILIGECSACSHPLIKALT